MSRMAYEAVRLSSRTTPEEVLMDTMTAPAANVGIIQSLFEVLDGIADLVVSTCGDRCIPVKSVSEVRGWNAKPAEDEGVEIIDMKVDGQWVAFGL